MKQRNEKIKQLAAEFHWGSKKDIAKRTGLQEVTVDNFLEVNQLD